MKVSEASGKWCPFSRGLVAEPDIGEGGVFKGVRLVLNSVVGSFNRWMQPGIPQPGGCMCLGPGCAAWRWEQAWAELPKEEQPAEVGEATGYCGLAGVPPVPHFARGSSRNG